MLHSAIELCYMECASNIRKNIWTFSFILFNKDNGVAVVNNLFTFISIFAVFFFVRLTVFIALRFLKTIIRIYKICEYQRLDYAFIMAIINLILKKTNYEALKMFIIKKVII